MKISGKLRKSLLITGVILFLILALIGLFSFISYLSGNKTNDIETSNLASADIPYDPNKDPYFDRDIDENPIIEGVPTATNSESISKSEDGNLVSRFFDIFRPNSTSNQANVSSSGTSQVIVAAPNTLGSGSPNTNTGSTGSASSTPSGVGTTPSTSTIPPSTTRGYQPKYCGFDLNDNGIVGEAEDCRICNGVVSDIDGDGTSEDQLYVDADRGNDQSGNGTPQNPYKTISFAWSRADGPSDGAEDIICFKGTAKEENIRPPVAGVDGIRTKAKNGSEAIDWEYPKNPTMLVGWDYDKDGKYPPLDTDDVAVLDGSGDKQYRGLSYAFFIGPASDYLEMAHFTVKDYGRYYFPEKINPNIDPDLAQMSGFIQFGKTGNSLHHLYIHDLSLEDINRDRMAASHRIMFSFFKGVTTLNHIAFTNLNITNTASFMVRGAGLDKPNMGYNNRDEGPIRWQNLTVTARGARQDCGSTSCVPGAFTGWKLWGYLTGVEILDSVFDSQIREWETTTSGGNRVLFAHASECTQDWTIRNNYIKDFQIGLNVTGGNGAFCADNAPTSIARPVDKIVFDKNIFVNTYTIWNNVMATALRGGDTPKRTAKDMTVTSNIFSSVPGFHSCLWNRIGNDTGANPGKIVFSDNICNGKINSDSLGAVLIGQGFSEPRYHNENMVIERNLFTGLTNRSPNVKMIYKPQTFVENLNIFDSDGFYTKPGSNVKYQTLDEWRAQVATGAGSKECKVTFDLTNFSSLYSTTYPTCIPGTGTGTTGGSQTTGTTTSPLQNPVIFLKFEEGQGTVLSDSSGNNNNGSIIGSPFFANGKNGKGLMFDDSSDEIEVGASPLLNNLSQVTIMGWIKHQPISRFASIVDKRDGTEDGYNLYIDPSKKLSMRVNKQTLLSSQIVADNTWHHVAGVFNGNKMEVYVDGVLKGSVSTNQTIYTAAPLLMGTHWSASTYGFLGTMDDIKIYNRALSVQEIGTDMNTTYSGGTLPQTPPSVPTIPIKPSSTSPATTTPTTPKPPVTPPPTPVPPTPPQTGFYPTQLDNVKFFVEAARGIKIANCNSETCYNAGDNASLANQYCDTSIFSSGCVRRWEDQSGFSPTTVSFEPPEWVTGRDFGQDDREKPGYIPSCINGYPCVRGGAAIPPKQPQNRSLEIEPGQGFSMSGPFAIYILARPIPQSADYYYFGGGGNKGLRHNVADNSLTFTFGGYLNDVKIANANAVVNNRWHLIEIHRDSNNVVKGYIDGVETTAPNKTNTSLVIVNDVLSLFKGNKPMFGDMASVLVYGDGLTDAEKTNIRDYFQRTYKYLGN